MGYLLINGDDKHYNVVITPVVTQHGYEGIRLTGEPVPETDQGFKYFSDDDTLIGDYSEYTYLYTEDTYATHEDQPFEGDGGEPYAYGPTPYDRLSKRISQISSEVNELTPYSETKVAYINDTQLIFDRPRDGAVSVYMIDANGLLVNTKEIIEPHRVIVQFEKREITATVTMTIA